LFGGIKKAIAETAYEKKPDEKSETWPCRIKITNKKKGMRLFWPPPCLLIQGVGFANPLSFTAS